MCAVLSAQCACSFACNLADLSKTWLGWQISVNSGISYLIKEKLFTCFLFVAYVRGYSPKWRSFRHTFVTFKCEGFQNEWKWRDVHFRLTVLVPTLIRNLVISHRLRYETKYIASHVYKAFVMEIWRHSEGTVLWYKNFRHSKNVAAAQPPTNWHEFVPVQACC
jgi:hypothetical protein